jgi:hypothetical protein
MKDMNQVHDAIQAARAVRAIGSFVSNNPQVRDILPPDASPEFVAALTVGVAARMTADLLVASVPSEHALVGAAIEYISMSMGTICHLTQSDPELVARTADKVMFLLSPPPEEVGTPGIIMGEPRDRTQEGGQWEQVAFSTTDIPAVGTE